MKRVFLIALLIISILSLVLATNTILSTPQTTFNVNPGNSGSIIISYSIDNTNGGAGAKGVILTGSPRYISYSGGSVPYDANITTSGNITLNYLIPLNATGASGCEPGSRCGSHEEM